jgi:hypothetical protein
MALDLKHTEVERLASEGPDVAERRARILRFLQSKVWASIPKSQLGRRLTSKEEDAILGYGPEGV